MKDKALSWLVKFITSYNRLSLSQGSSIHPSVRMKGVELKGTVEIGEGCRLLGPGVRISARSKVEIGRYTSMTGPNVDILSFINPVVVGSFCSIARNTSVQEFNHRHDSLTTYHIHQNVFGEGRAKDLNSNGAVLIGNDVWIGTQCAVLSGARIGNGAVIAANSVVIGEIPPFAIAAGSPAKVIKYRFDEVRRKEIEEMAWWNWSVEKIKENRMLFA